MIALHEGDQTRPPRSNIQRKPYLPMSILVNKHTKVITEGMTGATGTFHTAAAR